MSLTTSHQTDLAALGNACGVVEFASVGRLFISGQDALDLLNRLTTNKLEELVEGQGATTVITNADGRVVDLLSLAALDDGFWCLTSSGYAQTVVDWLDLYTFTEDIFVSNHTDDTFHLTLAGPAALGVIANTADATTLTLDSAMRTALGGASVIIWRRLTGGADGYEVVGALTDRDIVLSSLVEAGARQASQDAWEAYRILNGMPAIDAEFGLFNNPLEARLLGAISETKGCYTGQEVLARLQTYNKIQRRLMGVELYDFVAPGTKLIGPDGKNAGWITSIAQTSVGIKGLALVGTRLATSGATLAIDPAVVEGVAILFDPPYALATEPIEV